MSNTILIKRSGTPGSIPNAANVSFGELAINYSDGTLFYKDVGGTVKVIASNQTFTLSGNIAAGNVTTSGVVSATGNVIAGNVTTVGQVSATGNVSGNYFIGNGRFLSGIDTTLISNGNSSVQTLANANITVNPGGIANVVVFNPAGGTVTGYWSVTGNVTSGNVNTAIVSASGNVNSANVNTGIVSASGNIIGANVTTAGIANIGTLEVTGSGQIGSTLSVTGTATVGNVSTAGYLSATGNVTGGNVTTTGIANIGTLSVTGTSGFTGNVTGSNISVSGNIAANGVLTDNYYYANGAPVDFQQAAGSNTQLQFNNNNDFGASANLTFDSSTNQFTLVGTANVTNLNVSSSASVTGNITGGNVNTGIVSASGNVNGGNINFGTGVVSGTGNVNSGNVNTGIVSASGNATAANFSTAGLISATGNITGGNVNTTIVSASGNITGANISAGSGIITTTGNVNSGNVNTAIVSASGNIVGANLSVGAGTISSTGNVNVGNVNTAIVSASGNITGANINAGSGIVTTTGNVIAGNVTTAGIANIGTLEVTNNGTVGGNLSVTGNITGGNLITNGVLSTTGNIGANNISITNTATATTLSATGSVIAGNITTSGTLTASGNIQSNATILANTFSSVSGAMTLQPASGNINLFTTSSGNVVLQSNYINNLASPAQATDAATKQYVDDAVSTGIHIHTPVYVETPVALPSSNYALGGTTHTVTDITTGNTLTFSASHGLSTNDQIYWPSSFNGIVANTGYFIYSVANATAVTLSTTYDGVQLTGLTNATGLSQTGQANPGVGATLTATANGALVIDSVSVTSTQRVLVYQQANAVQNGVYVVTDAGNITAPWILTRSSDTDTYEPDTSTGLDQGSYFYVQAGATGAGESYVKTAPFGPFVIGLDNIVFTQFSASQVYSANTSAGLTLTGTVFSALVDNNTTAFSGGNIVVKASANLTTPNIGAATGTSLSLSGNVVAGNLNAGSGIIATTGNVVGGNLLFGTGVVSGTGNIYTGNIDGTGLANIANLTVYTFANVTSSTAATDTTSGALRVAGGVGVVGNVYAGGMYVGTDSVLTINSTVDGGTY